MDYLEMFLFSKGYWFDVAVASALNMAVATLSYWALSKVSLARRTPRIALSATWLIALLWLIALPIPEVSADPFGWWVLTLIESAVPIMLAAITILALEETLRRRRSRSKEDLGE